MQATKYSERFSSVEHGYTRDDERETPYKERTQTVAHRDSLQSNRRISNTVADRIEVTKNPTYHHQLEIEKIQHGQARRHTHTCTIGMQRDRNLRGKMVKQYSLQ